MTRAPKTAKKPDATRQRLLTLFREGSWTVEDLAERLGRTDNAVRFHVAALERAGQLERKGLRTGGGAGQPAVLYSLTATAEESFSRAYAPILAACLAELRELMPTPQLVAFLKRVGKRLGRSLTSTTGSLSDRVAVASSVLDSLGGITAVRKRGNVYEIVGRACPVARAVEEDSCVCAAVTALVADVVDADVRERCDRSHRPKCCFEISEKGSDRARAMTSA
ncbi:MAG: helix-turn-helix transcriptional regulator [Gemmatimonadaceae bacterium]